MESVSRPAGRSGWRPDMFVRFIEQCHIFARAFSLRGYPRISESSHDHACIFCKPDYADLFEGADSWLAVQ